mmetsp:Transcript_21929/g.62457  ORF Transcript_21929/g.62457 Transcript_21929/m.62457 type:complete len:379 (+) Transcript_21929:536-1672(+)
MNRIGAHLIWGISARMNLTDLSYVDESLSTTASHLLQMMAHALPSSAIFCAKMRSCSVTPAVASSTSNATSARRMARSARLTMKNSGPKSTFPFLRMPAVSTKRYRVDISPSFSAGRSIIASIESRVVPAISLTMARSLPKMEFSRDDFPTFGRPMMAMLISSGRSTSSKAARASSYSFSTCFATSPIPYLRIFHSVSSSPGMRFLDFFRTFASCKRFALVPNLSTPAVCCSTIPAKRSSNSSAVPTPCNADTGRGSPIPKFQNSAAFNAPVVDDSHLLTATTTGISWSTSLRMKSAICMSNVDIPSCPSTTTMAPDASDNAIMACWRISLANNVDSSSSNTSPPVSTNWNASPKNSARRYVRSRVMPDSSATMAPPD